MVVVERDFFCGIGNNGVARERDSWNNGVLEDDDLSKVGRGLDWKLKKQRGDRGFGGRARRRRKLGRVCELSNIQVFE